MLLVSESSNKQSSPGEQSCVQEEEERWGEAHLQPSTCSTKPRAGQALTALPQWQSTEGVSLLLSSGFCSRGAKPAVISLKERE